MKRSRRNFLADLLFLGGGLTASALLVNSGGCDQSTTSHLVTQGVIALPDAVERLEALRARCDNVASPAPETPAELLDWNVNCSERNGAHPAGLGPG